MGAGATVARDRLPSNSVLRLPKQLHIHLHVSVILHFKVMSGVVVVFHLQQRDTYTLLWHIFPSVNLSFFYNWCVSAAAERAASLPELTPAQRNKLRHLSIISLASNLKVTGSVSTLCSSLTLHSHEIALLPDVWNRPKSSLQHCYIFSVAK